MISRPNPPFLNFAAAAIALAAAVPGTVVQAEPPVQPESSGVPSGAAEDVATHEPGEVALRFAVAGGLLAAIGHANGGAFCNAAGAVSCARPGGPFLDVEAAFRIMPELEFLAGVRAGLLEDEATDTRWIRLLWAIRLFEAPVAAFRPFFTMRPFFTVGLVTDLTGNANPANVAWGRYDVGVRGEIGLEWDVAPTFGMFARLGETITFVRSVFFVTDLAAGLSLRIP